jgi:hypothetical protein
MVCVRADDAISVCADAGDADNALRCCPCSPPLHARMLAMRSLRGGIAWTHCEIACTLVLCLCLDSSTHRACLCEIAQTLPQAQITLECHSSHQILSRRVYHPTTTALFHPRPHCHDAQPRGARNRKIQFRCPDLVPLSSPLPPQPIACLATSVCRSRVPYALSWLNGVLIPRILYPISCWRCSPLVTRTHTSLDRVGRPSAS